MTDKSPPVNPALIYPEWPIPDGVIALVTTRIGSGSRAPFDSFNLALHVKDNASDVEANRAVLQQIVGDGMHLQWLQQVHGTQVVRSTGNASEQCGDAVFVDQPGQAGVVMTADCLPVFFAARNGNSVAVAHAGWRGLLDGVLENTLAAFAAPASELVCWLGPAIGPCHFEVGEEVSEAFLTGCASDSERSVMRNLAIRPSSNPGKFFVDLYELARFRLRRQGVESVFGGGLCTFCDSSRFYSYRRDGETGRMVSVIGLKPQT